MTVSYQSAVGGRKSNPKGIVVAGLSGGSGKSVASVSLVAAYAGQGRKVVPFKKGPDYIDAGWLQLASGNPCYNLDPYLMEEADLLRSFHRHARGADLVIVEGNRGLYDGVNVEGAYSSAELAVKLGLPVLLVVDCTKTTRTVAAMVLGCKMFDRRVDIRGVVLNRIAGRRHEQLVRQAVEQYTGVKVVGVIHRSRQDVFPQRHLGVTPIQEHESATEAIAGLRELAQGALDLSAIEGLMEPVAPLVRSEVAGGADDMETVSPDRPKIGVIRDAAFQFYYPENLEVLARQADLVELNALHAPELPELDALYIGGGFPETSARLLAGNVSFRRSLKARAEEGLPIYAECGGLIYLGESIVLEGETYPLVGVFPVTFGLEKKPQAHGYTVLRADRDNPFYPPGVEIKGHEFRYSSVLRWPGKVDELAFEVARGVGFAGGRDGLVHKNVLALYTHIHAVGTPIWAESLLARARSYRLQRLSGSV